MVGDAPSPPPEGQPRLADGQLERARSLLALLQELSDRLTAASDDREALELLGRETHNAVEAVAAYGFAAAARFAAGMEATVSEWRARPDDPEVDRGSLAHWFVRRFAEMLGVALPSAPTPPPRGRPVAPQPARPSPTPPSPAIPAPRSPSPPPAPPPRGPAPSASPVTHPSPSAPGTPDLPWVVPPPPRRVVAPAPPAAPPPRATPRPAAAGQAPAPAAAGAEPASPGGAPSDAPGVPQVIYVEDDAALAELLEYGLRLQGYRYQAYHNGREALDALRALDVRGTHPLLLLDVDLPGLDGYSIFDALQRERPDTYRVVFTTVRDTEDEQLRGLEAGALDYLVKPIGLRVVLEKIKRWVGR
ncbi:MAG TPA: response regulator [Gemmatimonadales bacterium]|nr:response regulator [Gemmatimonadales bacterium]